MHQNAFQKGERWITLAMLTLTSAAIAADTGFIATSVSNEPGFSFETTRGWIFGLRPNLPADQEVVVTHLGVFDAGGDGLINSHEIGLWQVTPGVGSGILLGAATVPTASDAALLGGYRYVPIAPVVLPSGGWWFAVGAFYEAGDSDDLMRPIEGQFAPEISSGVSVIGFGTGLTLPYSLVPFGPDRPGIYKFFPVNFQFSIIPEPSTGVLLAGGLFGLFMLNRRKRWL